MGSYRGFQFRANLVLLADRLVLPVRTRWAPTPSGYLHMGNAFNFLIASVLHQLCHGSLRLRIDDVDVERRRPEFIDDIFEQLHWLGLTWQEGPQSPRDHEAQSGAHRLALFQKNLKALPQDLLFACKCSRSDIQRTSKNGLYPGTCRDLGLDKADSNMTLRLKAQGTVHFEDLAHGSVTVDLATQLGDFVVLRKGALPGYHLASLSEDLDHQTTLVVRGEDLLTSTAAQIHLSNLLGKAFHKIQFLHHPLISDLSGEKLSKSEGALSLRTMRQKGADPSVVFNAFADWIGVPGRPANLQELLQAIQG